MPDEHDTLVLLVQELQETANALADKVAELDQRTISLVGFGLTNELHRIDQILLNIQERLAALEGKEVKKDSRVEWFEKIDREIAEGKRCGVGDNFFRCAAPKPCPTHDLGIAPDDPNAALEAKK